MRVTKESSNVRCKLTDQEWKVIETSGSVLELTYPFSLIDFVWNDTTIMLMVTFDIDRPCWVNMSFKRYAGWEVTDTVIKGNAVEAAKECYDAIMKARFVDE